MGLSWTDYLAEIEARANAATAGPWQTRFLSRMMRAARSVNDVMFSTEEGADWFDSEFIAAARTDIPRLIARVRELEEGLRFYERTLSGTDRAIARAVLAKGVGE